MQKLADGVPQGTRTSRSSPADPVRATTGPSCKAAATRRSGARRLLDERPQLPAVRLERRARPLEQRSAGQVDLVDLPQGRSSTSTPTTASTYGLPKDIDTIGVWYNKTLFDAKGVAYPDGRLDLGRLQAAAAQADRPGQGRLRHRGPARRFQAELLQHDPPGRRLRDLARTARSPATTTPRRSRACEFWTDLIKAERSPDAAEHDRHAPADMFEAGKIAMYWGGSWNAAEFAGNAVHQGQGRRRAAAQGRRSQATIIHGVPTSCRPRPSTRTQAWEFVEFLGSKQAADILGKTRPVIPAYNGTAEAWVSRASEVQAADLPRRGGLRGAVPGLQEHRRLERGGAHLPHQGVDRRGSRSRRPPPTPAAAMNALLAKE